MIIPIIPIFAIIPITILDQVVTAVVCISCNSVWRPDYSYRAMSGESQSDNGAQIALQSFPEHLMMNAETHLTPIVEVAFKHGSWWSIPQDVSARLLQSYRLGEAVEYTWDWGEGGRVGSYAPNGEETQINRYSIDFANCVQTNVDNQRKRSVRVIWIRPQEVVPQWTGQLSGASS